MELFTLGIDLAKTTFHLVGMGQSHHQSAHCVLVRSSLRPMLQGQLRLRVRSVLSRLLWP